MSILISSKTHFDVDIYIIITQLQAWTLDIGGVSSSYVFCNENNWSKGFRLDNQINESLPFRCTIIIHDL